MQISVQKARLLKTAAIHPGTLPFRWTAVGSFPCKVYALQHIAGMALQATWPFVL